MKKYTTLGVLLACFLLVFSGIVQADLNDGLVAYYPFNGNADDESENGNDGEVNGAILTTDRFGIANNAYTFDGINDYIIVQDDSSLDGMTSGLTVSVWVNVASFGDTLGIVWKFNGNSDYYSDDAYAIHTTLNNTIRSPYYGGNTDLHGDSMHGAVEVEKSLLKNTWYHYVFIWDKPFGKIYLNGTLNSTGDSMDESINNSPEPLYIGSAYFASEPAYFFSGKIDDIRIYNRALSETEIKQLYWGAGHLAETNISCPTVDDRYDEGFQAGIVSCQTNNTGDNCAVLEDNFDITMPCIDVFGTQLPIGLERFTNPDDPFGYYWNLNIE